MAMMRVAQVSRPKGSFEIVERQIPAPGAGSVRIKVQACGICHSDSLTKEGGFPGLRHPRVPGHEVAGLIDASAEAALRHRTAVCFPPSGFCPRPPLSRYDTETT